MKRYGAIWFLVLLVVPALLTGMALYRWLGLEQERIGRSVVAAAEEQARAVAESIQLTVEELTGGLSERLAALDPATAAAELRRWEDQHPLIRHGFVWREPDGLVFPDLAKATDAERRFARRYEALFRSGASWGAPLADAPAAPPAPDASSPRRQVRRLTQDLVSASPAAQPDPSRAGWIPWFEANQLHLLGWATAEDGTRYGVEIETFALAARFAALMPDAMPPGQSWRSWTPTDGSSTSAARSKSSPPCPAWPPSSSRPPCRIGKWRSSRPEPDGAVRDGGWAASCWASSSPSSS